MKHTLYILSWLVLGLLLSFLAHAGIEMAMIKYSLIKNIALTNYGALGGQGYCVLPTYFQAGLIVLGIVGSLWAGVYSWRVIYIEHRYKRKSSPPPSP